MLKKFSNKAVSPADTENKAKVGEQEKQQFFFPAKDGYPAMTVWAGTIEEATAQYHAQKSGAGIVDENKN